MSNVQRVEHVLESIAADVGGLPQRESLRADARIDNGRQNRNPPPERLRACAEQQDRLCELTHDIAGNNAFFRASVVRAVVRPS